MPFSITTKDGITINNIPDNIEPDSDILRQRVAEIRAGNLPEQKTPDIVPEQISPENVPGQQEPSTLRGVAELAATVGSGLIAEPLAGIAGGVMAALPGEPGAGARAIEATRKALTFVPREAGQALAQNIGEAIPDVVKEAAGVAGEAVTRLEDISIQKFGPEVTTALRVLPEAILLRLGIRKVPGGLPDISPQRAKELKSILQASERTGIDVLTSDVFEPKSIFSRLSRQFAERVPLLGTGGKRAAQQEQRIAALDDLEQSLPRVEAQDIFTSLQGSVTKRKNAAGSRLNAVVTGLDPLGAVPVTNTTKAVDVAIARLNRPGKQPDPALLKELETLKATAPDAGSSFSSLREFRTDARSVADKVDVTGRSQLRSTDKALLDNVTDGITRDLDSFVLSNTNQRDLQRYKAADNVYRQEARILTKSRIKNVLDAGDIKPELVNNLLFSSSPSEVKLLFNNLGSSGRQNARIALYRRALDRATKQGQISPQRFTSELDKLRDNFDVFFRGESRAELNGLKRLLETTSQAGKSGVVGPTGQTLQIPSALALGAAAGTGNVIAIATILGAGTVGLSARAFESSGVRDTLIRLGKAPRRSTLGIDLKKSLPALLELSGRVLAQEQTAQVSP